MHSKVEVPVAMANRKERATRAVEMSFNPVKMSFASIGDPPW